MEYYIFVHLSIKLSCMVEVGTHKRINIVYTSCCMLCVVVYDILHVGADYILVYQARIRRCPTTFTHYPHVKKGSCKGQCSNAIHLG